MQNLIRGLHRFQQTIFPGKEELFHDLVEGQSPSALFVTCGFSNQPQSAYANFAWRAIHSAKRGSDDTGGRSHVRWRSGHC